MLGIMGILAHFVGVPAEELPSSGVSNRSAGETLRRGSGQACRGGPRPRWMSCSIGQALRRGRPRWTPALLWANNLPLWKRLASPSLSLLPAQVNTKEPEGSWAGPLSPPGLLLCSFLTFSALSGSCHSGSSPVPMLELLLLLENSASSGCGDSILPWICFCLCPDPASLRALLSHPSLSAHLCPQPRSPLNTHDMLHKEALAQALSPLGCSMGLKELILS